MGQLELNASISGLGPGTTATPAAVPQAQREHLRALAGQGPDEDEEVRGW